jgi:hypothetical protein
MSWLTEWKAISAQIQGLFEVSRFYFETLGQAQKDAASVGFRELVPHIKMILATLEKFKDNHKESIPPGAAESLDAVLNKRIPKYEKEVPEVQGIRYVQVMVTVLVSFRTEFQYHLSDTAAVARRLSERAFRHLQWSIVADSEFRRKWIEAFEKGEPACERLGAVHLLLHGIWAFKVNTEGEKTDLVFNDPILQSTPIERTAEALVLTEWKRVLSPNKTATMAGKAREQAARYTVGALGGVELAGCRFIVLVSEETLKLPEDRLENGLVYRHVNIAVDPKPPSKS